MTNEISLSNPLLSKKNHVKQDERSQSKKFLFVSDVGLIGDLAYAVRNEGNEVRYCIRSKADRDVSDGFVEKTDDWESLKDWADVIIFDDIGFGAIAERLRKDGKAVVAGLLQAIDWNLIVISVTSSSRGQVYKRFPPGNSALSMMRSAS